MNKQLEQQLRHKYPDLFRDDPPDLWIGDGWHPLLDELCQRLQALADQRPQKKTSFCQVKEKFGLLRIYLYGSATQEMYDLIEVAEEQSSTICESCGAQAKTTEFQGWLKTWCPACNVKGNRHA